MQFEPININQFELAVREEGASYRTGQLWKTLGEWGCLSADVALQSHLTGRSPPPITESSSEVCIHAGDSSGKELFLIWSLIIMAVVPLQCTCILHVKTASPKLHMQCVQAA